MKYMQDLLKSNNDSLENRRILGCMLRLYLREVYPITLFQGNKLNKKEKLSQLKKLRHLVAELRLRWC